MRNLLLRSKAKLAQAGRFTSNSNGNNKQGEVVATIFLCMVLVFQLLVVDCWCRMSKLLGVSKTGGKQTLDLFLSL